FTETGRRAGDQGNRLARFDAHACPGFGISFINFPFTTMRCASLCFGWHAISVTVGVGVGLVTHMSLGTTICVPVTAYTQSLPFTWKITLSPGARRSMLRNGWLCVTRWPGNTELPRWHGTALPGQ